MGIDQSILNKRVNDYLEKNKGKTFNNMGGINSFTWAINQAQERRNMIGEPIPWVQSAINMPYMETIQSFVFGSNLPAINTMTLCLEFVFRLAHKYWENDIGSHDIDTEKLTRPPWKSLFDEAKRSRARDALLPNSEERKWWKDLITFRNKISHFDAKYIIENYKDRGYWGGLRDEINKRGFRDGDYNKSSAWGFIYHRLIYALAEEFMQDANERLHALIGRTKWHLPVEEHSWGSHKDWYDDFFSLDWRPFHLQLMLEQYIEKSPGAINKHYDKED